MFCILDTHCLCPVSRRCTSSHRTFAVHYFRIKVFYAITEGNNIFVNTADNISPQPMPSTAQGLGIPWILQTCG